MTGIVSQFIALQKAANARSGDKRQKFATLYANLADAIATLPLDSLAGEPALEFASSDQFKYKQSVPVPLGPGETDARTR